NPITCSGARCHRRSIHELPLDSVEGWTGELCKMLRSCGQSRLAERLASSSSDIATERSQEPLIDQPLEHTHFEVSLRSKVAEVWWRFNRVATKKLRAGCRHMLHQLENRYGYFLPYHLSQAKNDEFFSAARDVARDERVRTILVIGAAGKSFTTQAILTGAKENLNKALAF